MKVLVAGAGAVGLFYGGKLSEAGAKVSILSRNSYDKSNIKIKSVLGNYNFKPANIFQNAKEFKAAGLEADLILVAYKVLPEIDVYKQIKDAVTAQTTILLLQNGINIESPVAKAFPNNNLISGLAFTCITRPETNLVSHTDYGHLTIGNYPCGIDNFSKKLAKMFKTVKIKTNLSDNIEQDRWKKLIWNAPFNPISVLAGGKNTTQLLASTETKTLIKAVMKEVLTIAWALDYELSNELIEQNIQLTNKMKPYKPSMCLDMENNRPLEVEAILGNTLKLAKKNGISTPHLTTLYALLQQINDKNINKS